jgi:putative Mg2+ transporter-C (MgtC) family protein
MERLVAYIGPWLADIWEPMLRLALVTVSAGLIGWEREVKGQSAGMRTHAMVALGATLFTLVSIHMSGETSNADALRVVTGVAQGIGFLGAGMIFREKQNVKGLTTAATIWVMGALGIAWGIGCYSLAILATAITYLILQPLKKIERTHLKRRMDAESDR